MTEKVRIIVPRREFRASPEMQELWNRTGDFIDLAQKEMTDEAVYSVILSRVAREIRRNYGAEAAQEVLQGFVDTMIKSAKNDLPLEDTTE